MPVIPVIVNPPNNRNSNRIDVQLCLLKDTKQEQRSCLEELQIKDHKYDYAAYFFIVVFIILFIGFTVMIVKDTFTK